MRDVSPKMTKAWKSPAKVGDYRPVVRATIQEHNLKKFDYDTAWANGGTFEADRHRTGRFTSILFGDKSPMRELRNIQNYSWERSVDQDVATCSITLLNTELSAIGVAPDSPLSPDDFEKPGWFTYNRGDAKESDRWGYNTDTGWNGLIVPDRIVKTYEGYGVDPTVPPAMDKNLVQSGTWMIDKVVVNSDGTITLEMRDLGRLLLDQIVFPPVVPMDDYPLSWSKIKSQNVAGRDALGGAWEADLRSRGDATSSNEMYVGKGLTNAPYPHYVTNNGGVEGHHARHVLMHGSGQVQASPADAEKDLYYWWSTGQDTRDSKVWWEYEFNANTPLAALRLRVKGGPYRIYISVHNGDKWLGRRKVPYKKTTGGVDIDANIPFVTSAIADRNNDFDVILPRAYNAKKFRITFGRLKDSRLGEHPWRAGLRQVQIYTAANKADLSFGPGEKLKVVGNYADYTHIVKWVCAWGGFFWPPSSTGMDFYRLHHEGEAQYHYVTYDHYDPVLPKGRVWGDFMRSGTAGIADLTVDMFDKKPLMDIISYVRDLLGFVFWVDETGGIVWRLPNYYSLGNYHSPYDLDHRGRTGRTSEVITIDEKETLLAYSTTLDSANIRERIFVGNAVGGMGVVIKGFNPYPVGLRRVAGWTDQRFNTKQEVRVMADMISARQMFTYRRATVTIPGNPAIQIDDQVRIFERVTNETYYHYVMGIKCELDMSTGEWTYDLDVHWLGEDPNDVWVVDVDVLDGATQQYLNAVGYTPTGDEDKAKD
jgi:hypothetical protein